MNGQPNSQPCTFYTRKAAGLVFSQKIFTNLRDWGFSVALNGTEHTHPDFVKLLHSSEDQTSLIIRYQPDGVICIGDIPRSAYVEAKKSKYIEKNAYDNYMRLQAMGCILFIVIEYEDEDGPRIGFQKIENLRFRAFPLTSRFPIIDDWFYPRKHPNWIEIKLNGFKGSGTPYREIDTACLSAWQLFRQVARINLA